MVTSSKLRQFAAGWCKAEGCRNRVACQGRVFLLRGRSAWGWKLRAKPWAEQLNWGVSWGFGGHECCRGSPAGPGTEPRGFPAPKCGQEFAAGDGKQLLHGALWWTVNSCGYTLGNEYLVNMHLHLNVMFPITFFLLFLYTMLFVLSQLIHCSQVRKIRSLSNCQFNLISPSLCKPTFC